MKQFIFIYFFFFSSYLISQEGFNGSWKSDDSNYYLTINGENFSNYKFVLNKPINQELKCDRYIHQEKKSLFIKKIIQLKQITILLKIGIRFMLNIL